MQNSSNDDTKKKARDADFSALENESLADATGQDGIPARNTSCEADGTALNAEIQALRKEADDFKDKYLRSLAEFENYRKRALKERSDLLKYEGERILQDTLEVVDNFELALQHADGDPAKFKTGIEMIYKLLLGVLTKREVRSEPSVGKDFDPTKHEALSKIPVNDAKPGTVLNEMKKAYFFKDKLLRPAQVVVAAEPVKNEQQADAGAEPSEP